MVCDEYIDDVCEVEDFEDFEDDTWYLCDDDEDEEYGEDFGFEYEDFDEEADCLVEEAD